MDTRAISSRIAKHTYGFNFAQLWEEENDAKDGMRETVMDEGKTVTKCFNRFKTIVQAGDHVPVGKIVVFDHLRPAHDDATCINLHIREARHGTPRYTTNTKSLGSVVIPLPEREFTYSRRDTKKYLHPLASCKLTFMLGRHEIVAHASIIDGDGIRTETRNLTVSWFT
jgi:hypothetical protein